MKRQLVRFFLVVFFLFPAITGFAANEEKTYTAYNMWFESPDDMRCINFKQGEMIPAGTEVNDFKLIENDLFDDMPQDEIVRYIKFNRSADGKTFMVKFTSRYHPGKNISDYFAAMFTDKPFDQLTAGLTEREIYAIRRGVLIPGMSKAAVLIDYGRPPEHHTPDLESKTWHYWVHRNFRKDIYFDEINRTMPVL